MSRPFRPILPVITLACAVLLAAPPAPAHETPEHAHAKLAKPKVKVLVDSTKDWTGTPLPEFPEGQPELKVLRITVPPKSRIATHEHPVYNAAYILKGAITVVMSESGQEHTYKEGDAFVEVMNKWHYGRNDADTPAELIVFYAGPKGTPISVKQDANN